MAIKPVLKHTFFKNDGTRNAGGKVWTYAVGTTTPTTTYTTSAATVANTNPIILDSHGECELWTSGLIKVNVLESDDTQVTGWPVDYVGSGVTNDDANARWAGTATGTANAIAITPSPAITAYAIGQSFIFKAGAAPNSAATTIAISGLTPIAAQSNVAAMTGGEILANNVYVGVLDTLTTCQISKIGEPTLAELGAAALAGSASQSFSTLNLTVAGLQKLATGANIASAATIDLSTATGNLVHITGTTATSAVTMASGQWMRCIADGAWPLTYHATTNRINGGASITLEAGDTIDYFYDGVTVIGNITRKNGISIASANRSEIRVDTANGYGSTNTKIRRFTNSSVTGTDVTYADSVADGGSFTINIAGHYAVSYTDKFSGLADMGLSLNTTTPTTGYQSIAIGERLSGNTTAANTYSGNCNITRYFAVNDVIRAHTDGTAVAAGAAGTLLTISRIK